MPSRATENGSNDTLSRVCSMESDYLARGPASIPSTSEKDDPTLATTAVLRLRPRSWRTRNWLRSQYSEPPTGLTPDTRAVSSPVATSPMRVSRLIRAGFNPCRDGHCYSGFAQLRFVSDSLTGLRGLISARRSVVLQHADSSPRLVGLAASRIGEKRQQPHPERQTIQLRRGM